MSKWISVEEHLPETVIPVAYAMEKSTKVLVKINDEYPFIAHLHKETSREYHTYAHGNDINGSRYTWLNPYMDIHRLQKITHWKLLNC